MKSIAFMPRKPGTTRARFREYYENRHAPLAAPLFPFRRYRRNHLADETEPGFDTISEFWSDRFDLIGELMAGEVGEAMRADERNFLDQDSIVAAMAEPVLEGADDAQVLWLLDERGGSREALVDACRTAGASLDFLSAMGDGVLPHDAVARVGRAEPALPHGWIAAYRLPVDPVETDMVAAHS